MNAASVSALGGDMPLLSYGVLFYSGGLRSVNICDPLIMQPAIGYNPKQRDRVLATEKISPSSPTGI